MHSDHHWYVLYTYPNSEKKVFQNLQRDNIETFLPLQKVIRQWSDRKKILEVPLFPNYIFVHIRPNEKYKALNVSGIVKYVSFDNKPVFVDPNEISLIKNLVQSNYDLFVENEFSEGDLVYITQGPFAGLEGVLFERKGQQRFGVRIASLSQTVSIEISSSCFRKLNLHKELVRKNSY